MTVAQFAASVLLWPPILILGFMSATVMWNAYRKWDWELTMMAVLLWLPTALLTAFWGSCVGLWG